MARATELPRPWTRDSLADHIESEVVPRVGLSGQALPSERTLAETLGVSRSLVREVLRGLEQRGVVDIVPGKGAYPRHDSPGDTAGFIRRACLAEGTGTDHLMDARLVVEGGAAALAAGRCTPDEVSALTRILDDRDASQGLVNHTLAMVAFHALVVRCTVNPVLIALHAPLSSPTFESMIRADLAASTSAQIGRQARSVVEAMAARDPQGSTDAMLRLHELERSWTCRAASRPEALVADDLQRSMGPSTSLKDLLESVITRYSTGRVVRKVAIA